MTPQLIDIRQLLPGDEIIISGNSKLKYMKVLSKPTEKDRKTWIRELQPDGTFEWKKGTIKVLKSFRCSIYQEEEKYKDSRGREYTSRKYIFEPDVLRHNKKISIDLNGRDVLLVKREER